MKYKKVLTTLVLALALVGAFTVISSAANGLQEISAYLNSNITVKMDGEPQTFLDANGARVYPISYKGTTYLPIRAVAGLVGLDVDWDQATQTVLLGESAKSQGVDLIDTFKPYAIGDDSTLNDHAHQVQSNEKQSRSIGGVEVTHWLDLSHGAGDDIDAYAYYNIGGKYSTLTFEVTCMQDTTLYVYGDNESILGEIQLTANQVPKKVIIPLLNTTQLHFRANLYGNQSLYIINAFLT